MPNLQRYSQEAMQDLSDAFPKTPKLSHDNLDRFLEVRSHSLTHTLLVRKNGVPEQLS